MYVCVQLTNVMTSKSKTTLLAALLFSGVQAFGQSDSAKNLQTLSIRDSAKTTLTATPKPEEKKPNALTVSADVRIRSELRHGYRNVAIKDTTPAFFVNQRSRLNFDFKSKRFDLYASLQDARVWGQQDPREGQGTNSSVTATSASVFPVYFYELYAEPHFNDKWSLRIGRQRVVYDNQRLFAENDWRLSAASHDAVRLIYNNNLNFSTELLGAYNQSAENITSSNYVPNGFKNYKNLLVHYLNWKMSKTFVLTTLNTMDGYQSAYAANTTYQRFTSGGQARVPVVQLVCNHEWLLSIWQRFVGQATVGLLPATGSEVYFQSGFSTSRDGISQRAGFNQQQRQQFCSALWSGTPFQWQP